jgi:transposase
MWVPPENKDPIVLHAPTRKSIACFGAVQLRTGRLVNAFSDVFDAATFECFLRMLLRHRSAGRTMHLILDNARYHHARLLGPYLEQRRATLALDYLPPYSPQLNPIERVWKLSRRLCTHNQHFPTLDLLIESVDCQFEKWEKPNHTLRKLCGII